MKLTMRKPTHSEVYTYKNMFYLALALFVFIPLISSCIIYPVSLVMQNNVAYENIMPVVSVTGAILSLIGTYGGFGLLAVTVCYFGNNGRGVIILAFLSNLITYMTLWFVHITVNPYADEGGSLVTMVIEILVNTAFVFIIYFAIIVYAKKKKTFMDIPNYGVTRMSKHPFTGVFILVSLIYLIINTVIEAATMIGQFLDPSIGLPRNTAEILSLVMRYAYLLLYTAAGFAIMVLVGILVSAFRKRGRTIFASYQGLKL